MKATTNLLTARLSLHPLTLAEAEQIIAGQPWEGARWAPDYPFEGDLAAVDSGLRNGQFTDVPATWAYYQIRLLSDGQAVGGIGLFGPPDEHGRVEIGYGLAASARGSGFAAEALTALAAWALAHGAALVEAETTPDNLASQRTLGNAGFSLVSTGSASELLRFSITGAG